MLWRLEQGQKVLTGWNESNDAEQGNLMIQIKDLTGEIVSAMEMNEFFDIIFYFSGGKAFRVFCDVTPQYEPKSYKENNLENGIISNIKDEGSRCFTRNVKRSV